MSEQNKALVRQFQEVMWHTRNHEALDTLIDANRVTHGPFTDDLPSGPAGDKAFAATFLTAFPDVRVEITKQETDGDVVKTWLTYHATQTGPLMNIPATGKRVIVPVLFTDHIVNGKIAESWTEWDPQDMMRQLGVG